MVKKEPKTERLTAAQRYGSAMSKVLEKHHPESQRKKGLSLLMKKLGRPQKS